jgi:hypothetical protein
VTPDLHAEVSRLVDLGATLLGDRDGGRVELADPDGNEFQLYRTSVRF